MIVVVAPYSPPDRGGYAHLGGSRKLETVISILAGLGLKIVLVNSAHNEIASAPLTITSANISGINVTEITPPLSKNSTIGKLKNIFSADLVIKEIQRIGIPKLIWFYNGYAFEMRMAKLARQAFNAPMILEFEDWHFSRSRGFNPKPYLDYFFWRTTAKLMSGAFVVNEVLASKMRPFTRQIELLPGVVPQKLADIANTSSVPFSSNSDIINVGFFGGLTEEKGAGVVMQLAAMLPEGYVLHVTGSGPLATELECCARQYPRRLTYHGRVNDDQLYELIAGCDVMLNPHASIEEMNDGVFPFKVIEAVASGRLLISTSVPREGLDDVLQGVLFVEHSADSFHKAILTSRAHYLQHILSIRNGAARASQRFGGNAILCAVRSMASKHGQ